MMRNRLSVAGFVLMAAFVWGQAKTPPETRNAALRYWQAFAEMKDPPADVPTREAIEKTIWRDADWDEAKLGPIVEENETALGIMQRATKLPECDWGVEYSQGPKASSSFVPRARVLARLNTLSGLRELHQGHSQAAVDTWIAGIRFAQDLEKGGPLLFALTAKSMLQEKMEVMTSAAKQARFSAAQTKRLSTEISALPEDGFDWGSAWEMDATGTELWFSELQRSPNPAHLYETMMNQVASTNCVPPSAAQIKDYHEYMGDVASALRVPPSVATQQLASLDTKAKAICEGLRNTIPNANRVNSQRADLITARKNLLEALGK